MKTIIKAIAQIHLNISRNIFFLFGIETPYYKLVRRVKAKDIQRKLNILHNTDIPYIEYYL